jgi:hypothetical protein
MSGEPNLPNSRKIQPLGPLSEAKTTIVSSSILSSLSGQVPAPDVVVAFHHLVAVISHARLAGELLGRQGAEIVGLIEQAFQILHAAAEKREDGYSEQEQE